MRRTLRSRITNALKSRKEVNFILRAVGNYKGHYRGLCTAWGADSSFCRGGKKRRLGW